MDVVVFGTVEFDNRDLIIEWEVAYGTSKNLKLCGFRRFFTTL